MIKLFLSSLILICLIYADSQYAHYTFDMSNTLTIDIQQYQKNDQGYIELIIQFFSIIGDRKIMQIIMIFIWLKSKDIIQALKILMMYSISSFLVDLIKMLLQQPRPFYINEQIQLYFCHTGFGGPSGHASRALVFYYIVLESFLLDQIKDQNINNNEIITLIQNDENQIIQHKNKQIKKIFFYIMLTLLTILTGQARLFFGVHFLNQIILGWIIGFYLLFIYYKCGFQNMFDSYLQKIINQEEISKFLRKNLVINFTILFLILISFFCYYNCQTSEILTQNKNQWFTNVNQQPLCNSGSNLRYYNSFEKHDIIGTSIITLPFFLYILLLLNLNKHLNQSKIKKIMTKEGFLQSIFLFTFLLAPILYRRYVKLNILQYDSNIILQYFFIGTFYFFQISFVLLILFPLFQKYLKQKDQQNQKDFYQQTLEIEL